MTHGRVVLLARHGQTEWNLVHRRQGQLDSPLTELGRAQAERLAASVGAIEVIFTSPQGRAAATATACARVSGAPMLRLEDLREVGHGSMAGLTDAQIERRFPGEFENRELDKYRWRFPGGESYADADARAASALGVIMDADFRRALVVSHEMIGRMLLRNLVGLDVPAALAIQQPNDVVFHVDPESRTWSLVTI